MATIYSEDKTLPVAEIKVIGRVTQEDMDSILPKLTRFIEKHGEIGIVEIIESFEGFDASTIWEGLKFDVKHLSQVTHAAVVSDIGWIGTMTRAAGRIMPVTVRMFSMDEVDEARAWAREMAKTPAET